MNGTDLERDLRALFLRKAQEIDEGEIPGGRLPATLGGPASRPHVWQLRAIAAALVLVLGAVAVVALGARDASKGLRVASGGDGTAADGAVARSHARVWPSTADDNLPGPVPAEHLRTPDNAARTYLSTVAGLPADWPLGPVAENGRRAVVRYVLQDVPAEVRLEQDPDGLWFVTGAATDLLRPGTPGETGDGVEVALAPGPRTYESGNPVRVTAVAADGRDLASTVARVPAPANGGRAGTVVSLRWSGREAAAAVRADVIDDHDADPSTPQVVIGHWAEGIAPPMPDGLPPGVDPSEAEPVFEERGSADAVAEAYMRNRFPDHPAPGIVLDPARTRGHRATVRWRTGSGGERIAEGRLHLRAGNDGWAVVASTTAGVDLTGVTRVDGRLRGTVRSTNDNSLFADVLRLDGTPVPGSPRPAGFDPSGYRFGTAGGPADGALTLDVPVGEEPVLLRVQLVGGTLLSIAEVRIPAPPAP